MTAPTVPLFHRYHRTNCDNKALLTQPRRDIRPANLYGTSRGWTWCWVICACLHSASSWNCSRVYLLRAGVVECSAHLLPLSLFCSWLLPHVFLTLWIGRVSRSW